MKLSSCTLFKNTRINLGDIKITDYNDGMTIAFEDEVSENLCIVLEGKIHVKAYSVGGKNFTMNTLSPGQLFGDVLMFNKDHNTFPGSLITVGKTKIASIPNEEFSNFLKHDYDLLLNYLSMLSEKAYDLNYKSKMLSQDSVRDKILFFLYKEKQKQRTNTIQLNMTKEELANELYMQRPSLSRELIKMKQDGLIEYDRYSITILKDVRGE
jgi:CRP-like cAMP-binding protein